MRIAGLRGIEAAAGVATVEVLGEGIRTTVPMNRDHATVGKVIKAAGVSLREKGWDLFVDGVRRAGDHTLDWSQDSTISYAPRTRGG